MIDSEIKQTDVDQSYEYVAGGTAAVVIGYTDIQHRPKSYSEAVVCRYETAGVLTIGQALKGQHTSKLILDINEELNTSHNGLVDVQKIKRRFVQNKLDAMRTDSRTLAYTSSVLSLSLFLQRLS